MILTNFNQIYIINLLIGFILGPDRNSGSGPAQYRFWWNLAGTGSGPVPADLAGTRLVQQFFFMLYLGFMMSYLHHVPPPVLWLDHVHPSSSQTVSRATLEFTKCIMPPPPPPPHWRHLERNIIYIFTVCYFY